MHARSGASRVASLALVALLLLGCAAAAPSFQPAADPLPSWREGEAKRRILQFVEDVTREGGADFVPARERIAVFDNDGTLWSEKPLYFPVAFVFERLRKEAPEHPEWLAVPGVRPVLEDDREAMAALNKQDLLRLASLAETGMSQEAYRAMVVEWLATARHPQSGRRYVDLVYQPMLELLDHLRVRDFKIFIVTGGFADFVRELAEPLYDVPTERVIGSRWALRYEVDAAGSRVMRLPRLETFNNEEAKPANIEALIGRRPVLAVGNSDGDEAMLSYTDDRPGPSLAVLIHHDDSEREYDYDRGTENALETARERGWVVVSIRNDLIRVYSFE